MSNFDGTSEFLDGTRLYPSRLMKSLSDAGIGLPAQRVLDLGTGTGNFARRLSLQKCLVTGIDKSDLLLAKARELAIRAGVSIEFQQGAAEATHFPPDSFDIIVAAQCWHWFDSPRTAQEARRILRPQGKIAIIHFDPVPVPGNLFDSTERILDCYELEPKLWRTVGGSVGIYRDWLRDLQIAGFHQIESASIDQPVVYESIVEWETRLRGSCISSQLPVDQFCSFLEAIREETRILAWPQVVPHRCFWVTAMSQ
jgi:ubiquinone/menaquinone biosynthesis C-methylase UbiE